MGEVSTGLTWHLIALLAAAAMMGGCATATPADVQQMNSNQFAMRGLIATDRQEIDALKVKINQLQDQIEELRHGGGATGSGNQAQMTALEARVSRLERAMNPPPGGPGAMIPPPGESAGAEIGGAAPGAPPEAGVGPPEFATGTPPAGGEAGEGPGGEYAPEGPATAEGPDWHASIDSEITAANSSSDPGAPLYRKGLEQMKAGQYQDAAARFSTLMRRFPKSPLSEPAEYFSANALYESGKYDQAILQFNDVAMRFPKGRFTCAALLREGQAFIQINDRIDARLTLQKLINDHSDCPEASVASSMMRNLASE
jgi:tol-pal system protein YbgF